MFFLKKKEKMQNICFVSVWRSVQGTTQFHTEGFPLSFIHISVCMTWRRTPYLIVFSQIHTVKVKHLK